MSGTPPMTDEELEAKLREEQQAALMAAVEEVVGSTGVADGSEPAPSSPFECLRDCDPNFQRTERLWGDEFLMDEFWHVGYSGFAE